MADVVSWHSEMNVNFFRQSKNERRRWTEKERFPDNRISLAALFPLTPVKCESESLEMRTRHKR